MNFDKNEVEALLGLLPTVTPLLENSMAGWQINTRSLNYKAMELVYNDRYNKKINNTCAPCVESAVREIYNDYFRFIKSNEPKPETKLKRKRLK